MSRFCSGNGKPKTGNGFFAILKCFPGLQTMPERRAASHHRDRVAEALKDEVGTILEGELADRRIGLCYVTEVVLNPGGKSARIYVAVDGDETEQKETMEGLGAARAYIRNEVRDRLGKRHIPELSFH